jgi:hypothetical protein
MLKLLSDYKASGLTVEIAARVHEQTFGRVYLVTLKPYTIIHRDELSPRPGSLALQAIYTNLLGLVAVVLSFATARGACDCTSGRTQGPGI